MKVKELMELLGKYDKESKIKICVVDDGNSVWDIWCITKEDELYIDCGWAD